jgi:hypothetical protein
MPDVSVHPCRRVVRSSWWGWRGCAPGEGSAWRSRRPGRGRPRASGAVGRADLARAAHRGGKRTCVRPLRRAAGRGDPDGLGARFALCGTLGHGNPGRRRRRLVRWPSLRLGVGLRSALALLPRRDVAAPDASTRSWRLIRRWRPASKPPSASARHTDPGGADVGAAGRRCAAVESGTDCPTSTSGTRFGPCVAPEEAWRGWRRALSVGDAVDEDPFVFVRPALGKTKLEVVRGPPGRRSAARAARALDSSGSRSSASIASDRARRAPSSDRRPPPWTSPCAVSARSPDARAAARRRPCAGCLARRSPITLPGRRARRGPRSGSAGRSSRSGWGSRAPTRTRSPRPLPRRASGPPRRHRRPRRRGWGSRTLPGWLGVALERAPARAGPGG